MTANELKHDGWKPLTLPFTPEEGKLLAHAIAQLEKGRIPYATALDTHEGVEGWVVFTKPKIVMGEDV